MSQKRFPVEQLWFRLALAFVFWTIVGLLYAVQISLILERSNRPVTAEFLITGPLTFWYTWGLFSFAIVRLVHRVPIERGRLAFPIAVHIVAAIGCSFAHQGIYHLVHIITDTAAGQNGSLLSRIGLSFFSPIFTTNVVVYWMIVAGSQALDYYKRNRANELKAIELETALARAQLNSLKTQLHPHFLFNTLHAISSLMDDDTARARQMMARLSRLLRWTLDHGDDQEVTLADELAMVRMYLDIEQVRFQDRLTVRIHAGDELLNALVPAFLMQPIAENAIRHGIAQRTLPGSLRVDVQLESDRLILQVENDGPDTDTLHTHHEGSGIGLANTRARLQRLYGNNQKCEILTRDDGGTIVRIIIPFRILPVETSA